MSRVRISAQERSAALTAALETLKVIVRILDTEADTEAEKPTEQEQEILNVWDDLEEGTKLTTSAIAKLTGNYSDNGSLKRRLAEMVRKNLLINHNPGYSPTR